MHAQILTSCSPKRVIATSVQTSRCTPGPLLLFLLSHLPTDGSIYCNAHQPHAVVAVAAAPGKQALLHGRGQRAGTGSVVECGAHRNLHAAWAGRPGARQLYCMNACPATTAEWASRNHSPPHAGPPTRSCKCTCRAHRATDSPGAGPAAGQSRPTPHRLRREGRQTV